MSSYLTLFSTDPAIVREALANVRAQLKARRGAVHRYLNPARRQSPARATLARVDGNARARRPRRVHRRAQRAGTTQGTRRAAGDGDPDGEGRHFARIAGVRQ